MSWHLLSREVSALFRSTFDLADLERGFGHERRLRDPHADADRFIAANDSDREALRAEMDIRLATRIRELGRTSFAGDARAQARAAEARYRDRNRERIRLAAVERRAERRAA